MFHIVFFLSSNFGPSGQNRSDRTFLSPKHLALLTLLDWIRPVSALKFDNNNKENRV